MMRGGLYTRNKPLYRRGVPPCRGYVRDAAGARARELWDALDGEAKLETLNSFAASTGASVREASQTVLDASQTVRDASLGYAGKLWDVINGDEKLDYLANQVDHVRVAVSITNDDVTTLVSPSHATDLLRSLPAR